ncbi:MAG TPA: aminopeptidase [Phycisphaerae bacterium]|nr:aminopeptidase [Phycisphaerae bacterium]
MNHKAWPCAIIAVVSLLSCGCEVDYFAQLVGGELATLGQAMPISQALTDSRLTDDERTKLLLTQDVRQFGIDNIGLTGANSFTTFIWDGAGPAAYVLSASAKDSLTPYEWSFPLLGNWEAKGFFDLAMAQRQAQQLMDQGYDVFLGEASGFSTLGILPDPLRQSNLDASDEIDLAELILHEMTHSTVIKPSDTDFSESLATFIGRRAALAWFNERFGADSSPALAARDRFTDEGIIDEFINDLVARMRAYYADAAAQGMSRDAVIAGRQVEFDAAKARYETEYRPRLADQARWGTIGEADFNNAMLLTAIRYQGSLSDYQAVLDKVGGSFRDAIAVFQQAAAADDSMGFLRDWVASH